MQEHGQVDRPHTAGAQRGQQRGPLRLPTQPPQHHLHAAHSAVPLAALADVGRLRQPRAASAVQTKHEREREKKHAEFHAHRVERKKTPNGCVYRMIILCAHEFRNGT